MINLKIREANADVGVVEKTYDDAFVYLTDEYLASENILSKKAGYRNLMSFYSDNHSFDEAKYLARSLNNISRDSESKRRKLRAGEINRIIKKHKQ